MPCECGCDHIYCGGQSKDLAMLIPWIFLHLIWLAYFPFRFVFKLPITHTRIQFTRCASVVDQFYKWWKICLSLNLLLKLKSEYRFHFDDILISISSNRFRVDGVGFSLFLSRPIYYIESEPFNRGWMSWQFSSIHFNSCVELWPFFILISLFICLNWIESTHTRKTQNKYSCSLISMKCIQFSYVFVLLEVRSIKFIAVYLLILSIRNGFHRWVKWQKWREIPEAAAAGVQTVDF